MEVEFSRRRMPRSHKANEVARTPSLGPRHFGRGCSGGVLTAGFSKKDGPERGRNVGSLSLQPGPDYITCDCAVAPVSPPAAFRHGKRGAGDAAEKRGTVFSITGEDTGATEGLATGQP